MLIVAVALAAGLAIRRMPVDIFPEVGEPAIYVAQPYGGMDPPQMEGFLTYYYEYHFLYITGIQRVESQEHPGRGPDEAGVLSRHGHEPGDGANRRLRESRPAPSCRLEPCRPLSRASTREAFPWANLSFPVPSQPAGEMQDIALNRVRPLFATLPGVSAPPPFGGNQRTIVVRLDPDRLRQYGISPEEAIAAVNKASVGSAFGQRSYGGLNPIRDHEFGDQRQSLRAGECARVRLRTRADGLTSATSAWWRTAPISSPAYAHVDGKRTVYIPVTKRSDASTLAVLECGQSRTPELQGGGAGGG